MREEALLAAGRGRRAAEARRWRRCDLFFLFFYFGILLLVASLLIHLLVVGPSQTLSPLLLRCRSSGVRVSGLHKQRAPRGDSLVVFGATSAATAVQCKAAERFGNRVDALHIVRMRGRNGGEAAGRGGFVRRQRRSRKGRKGWDWRRCAAAVVAVAAKC